MMDRGPLETKLRPVVPLWDPVAYELARGRLQTRISLDAGRRRRRRRVGVAAGTAAALLAALLVTQVLLPPGTGGPTAGDASELHRLSVLAGRLPQLRAGKGYIYVRTKSSGHEGYEDVDRDISYTLRVTFVADTWLNAGGSGLRETTYRQVAFRSPADREAWASWGMPALPDVGVPYRDRYAPGELPAFDVERLPTDPDQLRTVLEEGTVIGTAPMNPSNMLSAIGALLATQTLAPEVRRGLLIAAADIPGVAAMRGQEDPLGRTATVVSLRVPSGESRLYLDPLDASLLAESSSYPGSGADIEGWTAYVRAGIVRVAGRIPRSN